MLNDKMLNTLISIKKRVSKAIDIHDLSMYDLIQLEQDIKLLDKLQDKQVKSGEQITIIGGK